MDAAAGVFSENAGSQHGYWYASKSSEICGCELFSGVPSTSPRV